MNLNIGSLSGIGYSGGSWSSITAHSSSNAYRLDFYDADTTPSYSNYRWVGFSVSEG